MYDMGWVLPRGFSSFCLKWNAESESILFSRKNGSNNLKGNGYLALIFLIMFPLFYRGDSSVPHPELLCNSHALQMICLGLGGLHNIHSRWCDASRITKSPHKNHRWWKPSAAQLAEGMEGNWQRVAASHSFSCSVFGASVRSLGFVSLSSLPVFISDSFTCSVAFPLSASFLFFTHPLFIPLSVAPRGLIYACGAAET